MTHKSLLIIFFLSFLILVSFNSKTYSAQKYNTNENGNWRVKIMFVKAGTIDVYARPSTDSKITRHVYYLDKILLISDENNPTIFGWKRILYPQNGYIKDKNLITAGEKEALNIRFKNGPQEDSLHNNWSQKIVDCNKEYLFVKKFPDYLSQTIALIKENENVLVISGNGNSNKTWTKILYPVEGYVKTTDLNILQSYTEFSLGFSYGGLQIPYEKSLKNYKNPLGGFIEFSQTNWDFSFGVGFSSSEANVDKWILKTQLFDVYIRYTFLRLFNKHVETYILAGGGYWESTFQNTKYPSLTNYFPLDKSYGYAYIAGGGIKYNLFGFFIGVQYIYWNSVKEGAFGPPPQSGKFTNQYHLYPGTNQVNVILGYKFKF